ncbi:LysR family transcriptional regulator [Cystobacter fuscus]|uniref:LysR family transcriptional regulator n=1 Tax=Cystobacter fuscus TaxID=43 RepID=UPI002B2CF97B|nr:LysR family transcriptional regulator [Cystobacter fuscus]
MKQPDLNATRVFVQVVESGSFRQAAQALGMPKSTVTRKVAELEQRLGTPLLVRSTRRIGLTEAGRSYLRHAQTALSALHDAERAIAEEQSSPRGLLSITASINAGLVVLPSMLAEFLRRYPDIRLSVELTDQKVDLIQRNLDVAVRIGTLPDSSLVSVRLGQSTLRLFASPDYLKARGEPRVPEDLLHHDCLVYGAQTVLDWTFQGARGVFTVQVPQRLFLNNFLVLRIAALAGLGIVRMPSFMGDEAVQNGQLRRLLDDYAGPPFSLNLLYPPTRLRAPKVRAFVEFMKAQTSDPGWIS